MNNWNRDLWIIFCIIVISSIGWLSTADALLHNIASMFGQANKYDQNRVSSRFHVERNHKNTEMFPKRSIQSIRRCFCIGSPTFSKRFFGRGHLPIGKMPIQRGMQNSMISRSQLPLIPAMTESYNQPLYFPKSSHVKIWRKGTKKSMSQKKSKHKQIQKKPKKFHLLHQNQKYKAWKKSHSKTLDHLKRLQHGHHKCKYENTRQKSKRSRKHALHGKNIHHKCKSRKSKRSKPHKLQVKNQRKPIRKHEKKSNRSKHSITRFSSVPVHHYHYHFYKCLPIQHFSQNRHAGSLFFRKPFKKNQYKRKVGGFYRKKRYTKRLQKSVGQRLPAYKVKRSYTRPALPRTRYVYNTFKRSRVSTPRVSTFNRRMGNRPHYQKAYRSGYIKGCAACRHRCPYDHSKYNTLYGRTRYANFMQNQQSSRSKRKRYIGSSWHKKSNPYLESHMNYNNFSSRQSKRYAPYMFYRQRFPTSIPSFQSRFYNNQPLGQYSGNMMGYQQRDTMLPTRTSAHYYSPYYYYTNGPYQYPSYNQFYTGLGMQSTNIPMNRVQGFRTQPTYLQKAAKFIHGIFGTGQHSTRSTTCSCSCPKSPTVVIHTNTNPTVSSKLSSGTGHNLGTCTKSGSTSPSL